MTSQNYISAGLSTFFRKGKFISLETGIPGRFSQYLHLHRIVSSSIPSRISIELDLSVETHQSVAFTLDRLMESASNDFVTKS